MAADAELAFLPALELAHLVRTRAVSPVELVELFLARIAERDPSTNAFITVAADQARAAAAAAELAVSNGDDLAPFHGVPVAVKDLVDTAGIRSTHGTAAWSERVPEHDYAVVRRIRRAGFVILGKTNVPEFGLLPITEPPAYGPCRNPWDLSRTSGGSSGGAAVAVATGMSPIAHGSDFGGSIRIPSSVCGIVGLKPSRGRVSQAPLKPELLSQHGPMTRTVRDAAAFLDVMAGYETGDAWSAPPADESFFTGTDAPLPALRVGLCTTPFAADAECHPANAAAAQAAAATLEGLGHHVVLCEPGRRPALLAALTTIVFSNAASRPELPPLETLDSWSAMFIRAGRELTAQDYVEALAIVDAEARRLVGFFDEIDVLMTPTVATAPPPIGILSNPDDTVSGVQAVAAFAPFTAPWNATGQPALSLPLGADDLGLPVGVQFVGRPNAEMTLLQLGAQLEAATPWIDRRPAWS